MLIIKFEVDENAVGACVLDGIVDGFLSDAQEITFNQLREGAKRAADLDLSLGRSFGGQSTRRLGQSRCEVVVFERLRAQVPDVAARFVDAVAHEDTRAVKVRLWRFGFPWHGARDKFELDGDA